MPDKITTNDESTVVEIHDSGSETEKAPVKKWCRFCLQRYDGITPTKQCPHPVEHECVADPQAELLIRGVQALENIYDVLERMARR